MTNEILTESVSVMYGGTNSVRFDKRLNNGPLPYETGHACLGTVQFSRYE